MFGKLRALVPDLEDRIQVHQYDSHEGRFTVFMTVDSFACLTNIYNVASESPDLRAYTQSIDFLGKITCYRSIEPISMRDYIVVSGWLHLNGLYTIRVIEIRAYTEHCQRILDTINLNTISMFQSVATLKLYGVTLSSIPQWVELVSMNLRHVTFNKQSSVQPYILNLHGLHIEKSRIDDSLFASVPNLKSLHITNCKPTRGYEHLINLTYLAVYNAGVNFALEDDSYVNRVFNAEMLWKEYQYVKTTVEYLTKYGKLFAMNVYIHGRTIKFQKSVSTVIRMNDPFYTIAGEEEHEYP
jgi:hypothetical protein